MVISRERALLHEWESRKVSPTIEYYHDSLGGMSYIPVKDSLDIPNCYIAKRTSVALNGGLEVTASLFATVWKIKCKPGEIIQSESDVLVILEAMKTEIPVLAGHDNIGKKIQRFGSGIKEGASVVPGETLVILN